MENKKVHMSTNMHENEVSKININLSIITGLYWLIPLAESAETQSWKNIYKLPWSTDIHENEGS